MYGVEHADVVQAWGRRMRTKAQACHSCGNSVLSLLASLLGSLESWRECMHPLQAFQTNCLCFIEYTVEEANVSMLEPTRLIACM